MHTARRHNQRLPKVDRFSLPPSNIHLPSEPSTNANKKTNNKRTNDRIPNANQRATTMNNQSYATTTNITGRYNKRPPKVDRSSPPPSNIHLPSGSATNANRRTTDSTRKRATRQCQRKQKQQRKQQDKPKLRTIFENRKAVMQFKAKKKSQRLQQQQERQQHQQLKLVHQELLQRATSQQHYHQQILLLNIRLLETKLMLDKNDRMLQARHDRLSHLAQQDKDAFNTFDSNVINKLVLQLCATLKTTQPAPTQTQQLRWKYGFVLHQMLTTTAHKAHRDMLQSVHNELTTNTPIIDAIHLRPSNNTVTSFHRQPSPTNILRCLLPTSFGFTHCNNCYYFHKLRPPDNITPAKQHLTNPFDTLYFFSKARPPDDDNNVVQQQHFNSFGNSYFFSKVRPPELTLHV